MKKYIAAFLTALTALSFFGCEKNENKNPSDIPDHTVSHTQNGDLPALSTDIPAESDGGLSTDDSVSVPNETEPSQTTNDSSAESSASSAEDDIEISEFPLKAMEYLELLNSDKVHAKLIEAVSYDNENIQGTEREYFVDGENKVYINGSQKIIMTEGLATVVDLDELTYYTYEPDEDEESAEFGYGAENYELVSSGTDEDGIITEVYSVSAHGSVLTSTWIFYPGGKFTVADVSPEAGSYYWYEFSVLETDTEKMDMSVPEYLTEIEPEEYF